MRRLIRYRLSHAYVTQVQEEAFRAKNAAAAQGGTAQKSAFLRHTPPGGPGEGNVTNPRGQGLVTLPGSEANG